MPQFRIWIFPRELWESFEKKGKEIDQKDDNETACIAGQDTGRNPQCKLLENGEIIMNNNAIKTGIKYFK